MSTIPTRRQEEAGYQGQGFFNTRRTRVYLTGALSLLVHSAGLEPARPYGHQALNLACLPIPTRMHVPEGVSGQHHPPLTIGF